MPRSLILLLPVLLAGACADAPRPELIGVAVLPADTFVEGPTSGQFIDAANGRVPPFENRQPVQGFSALLAQDDGSFLALSDNGFGSKENSPDYVLTVIRLDPEFSGLQAGSNTVNWWREFDLSDPNRHIAWPIIADSAFYPGSAIPVDSAIASHRLLTGADFDVESFRQVADGTFYFGDEFGPFLLHTDSEGHLIEPPIQLAGVWSPQFPNLGDRVPNAARSGGFEAMALSADGRLLYPMLERPVKGDDGFLRIYAYDLERGSYAHGSPNEWPYSYRLSPEAGYATEMVAAGDGAYLVIERDGGQGPSAKFKRVFRIHLDDVDEDGFLAKTEVLDLLDISDPGGLGEQESESFTFPYETTEALDVVSQSGLDPESGGTHVVVAIVNDNNYPFGQGRFWDAGEPDPNEMILVRLWWR